MKLGRRWLAQIASSDDPGGGAGGAGVPVVQVGRS
jgi:hypothetical protein